MSDAYTIFKNRDIRLFLISKFFITLGTQMQHVVLGWQVYQMTKDPLALGLIGLSEAIPFMGFLLWAGHQTDRSEKKRLILSSQMGLLGCSLALLLLALREASSPWPIYGVIAATGIANSFLGPSSSAYFDTTVHKEIYSQAAGWRSTLWQVGAILGPILGGGIYSIGTAALAYGGVVLILGIGVFFIAQLSPRPAGHVPSTVSSRQELMEGIRFVRSRPILWGAMGLDMFAVLFGGAVAILPFFAERLGGGSAGLGLLTAASSVGALLMALYQSHRPAFTRTGKALLIGVFIFGLCMVTFALSPWFLVSWAILAIGGAADNVSVVIRASILQAATPDHLRGRVSSVNGLFITASNELGAFESGVAARIFGVAPSVILGGLLTWVSVFVAAWKIPELRRLRLKGRVPEAALGEGDPVR